MTFFTPAFAVHGGAWDIPDHEVLGHLNGCHTAAQLGWSVLNNGGSALDAVETAIRALEDDPAFDAGRGAWLNAAGEVELDAIIMDGATLRNGAVAAIQHLRNPITAARLVMERTAHSLLVGRGAERFAEAQGIPLCDESELLTGQELERWKLIKNKADFKVEESFRGKPHGTVGAVAMDRDGHIAAGTSTGGTPNKVQGRVGDSPLIGCGCYADDLSAGVSTTGWGESIMKVVLAKTACELSAQGQMAQASAEKAIGVLANRVQGLGGLILIDHLGQIGIAFNTPRMARAWIENGEVMVKVEK